MRSFRFAGLFFAALTIVSCKSSNIKDSEEKSLPRELSERSIDPLAYNAYSIWKGKNVKPITKLVDLPPDYQRKQGTQAADGSIFVEQSELYQQEKFKNGTGPAVYFPPTPQASVIGDGEGDTLVYEDIGNGKLSLKFTGLNRQEKTHEDALQDCAKQGKRLPTAHELYDFCTAGIERGQFNYYDSRCRPSGRPKGAEPGDNEENTTQWTASIVSSNVAIAWWLNAGDGAIVNDSDSKYRTEKDPSPIKRICRSCGNTARFRCVGPAL